MPQEWADTSTCVLLERAGTGSERPGLAVTVPGGQPSAIAEVTLLSEFGRCQVFGDGGEYLATEEAELLDTVDDTDVLCLHHCCRPPVRQLTLQCVWPVGRGQLWVYGLEVRIRPAAAGVAFSMEAVLARVNAHGTPLSQGAEALRRALQALQPAGCDRAPAPAPPAQPEAHTDPSGVQATKDKLQPAAAAEWCGGGGERTPEASDVPHWLERAVRESFAHLEERMWRKITHRLDEIEQKQDLILEQLRLITSKGDK
ncbi:uncharacterized protein LOC119089391 isoform X2 [Pollicipes pollicipes]|nr:uncharacterized protein LOC119089391 isoform X2 [Pollicipes pollicipes]